MTNRWDLNRRDDSAENNTENLKVRMDLLPHDKARIPSTFYTRSTYIDR